MAGDERWYFTKEEINNSPSRKCGVDAEKELSYRQQGAKLIQDMGQRLQVTQLVINTAIVYMHRFYMFHPFTRFHRNSIAPAALFLAAKVEEQPRKLEHVIKVAHYILCHHDHTNLDTQSETYMEKAQELVMNENILLQTLGFDVAIDHPHTYVVKCFQMVRTPTELAQTSYFMATNSLHMTTMCLQYKPAVVACVCIYIVCKWSNYEIQRFTEGKDWFCHVDPTVTLEMLEMLTSEFLAVLDKYPNRLKKLMNSGPHGGPSSNSFGDERSRHGSSLTMSMRPQSLGGTGSSMRSHDLVKSGSVKALSQPSATSKTVLSHKEYSEKKEKERREREKERERVEHREKHTLHPPLTSTSSSSSSHHIPSSNTVSTHPPHISHSRSQPTEASVRKSHLDNNRQPVIHGSSNRGTIPAPAFKESNLKREVLSNRSDERLDKQERTSDNNVDSAKFVNEKLKSSGDHRHSHSGDWNQSRHLDYVKDRKVDLKTEIKTDIKPGLKDSRPVEGRDHKIESSTKVFENKNIPKNEPLVKVKSEKVESKDEFKVQGIDEIKSNNSFIFNNNDFSLRDFLNPSELPPEDIFDTEVDSKPNLIDAEFLPTETTHHKLKSPPKPYSLAQSLVVPTVSSSGSSKGNNSSNSKQTLDTLRANVEAKVSKHSSVTAAATNVYMHGNHTSDKNLGNGLHSAPNLMPSGPQTLQNPSSRRKEKGRSPHSLASHTPATKVKHQNSSSEPVSLPTPAKIEDHKQVSAKDSATTHNQVLPKDSQPGVPQRAGSAAPAISSLPTTSEKTGTLIQNQQSSFVPIKTSSLPEPPKIDTSINVRLSRPENCDVNPVSSAAAAAAAPAAAPAAAAPAAAAAPPPPIAANASSTVITSPVKKHKYDHGRHKHKEKKKHKHKEKDKHKEKESKDHKEHKKLRKHKKHKEKERERDEKKEKEKEREKQQPAKEDGVSRPLKITILRRNKGVYTPDVGSTTVGRTPTVTPVAEKDTPSSSNLDTPGRIKLTIPKSRLQVNAAPGSQGSPPRGIPPKELATPKVKLKIQKDHLKSEKGEKESRKRDRDRSPADNVHPSKISRSSSSYNAPQVGKNPLLPHTPLTKKSFQGKPVKQTAFSHVSQLPPQPHIQPILNPHPPLYPQNPQNHSYPIDQFGMPMSMNYSTYPPYGGMSIPNMPDPSFTQGGIAPNQYYAPFYPQYSLPMPNINIPPPPAYQTSHFNIPPPGYTPQPPQPYIPPQSQSSENPPLPAGPPPKKPPTPPLE